MLVGLSGIFQNGPMEKLLSVSDTAVWVAQYRAMESRRRDALFRDPWAARLAGSRGAALVRSIPKARASAWAMIVRTVLLDEIIAGQIRTQSVDCVLNLAAGLDTRPFRMDVPPDLHWIDADLPGILDYKASILGDARANCRYEAVRVDLQKAEARRALFARVGDDHSRVLVMAEGLLIYLTAADVRGLAADLHEQESFRWWTFDLASPVLLRFMERSWGRDMEEAGARMQFAPEEGTRFFLPLGWRTVSYRSTVEEGARLRRQMRLAPLWRLLSKLSPPARREEIRTMAGVVLTERADPEKRVQPIFSSLSSTAFSTANFRAVESERPDALFRDPWASRLAAPQSAELDRDGRRAFGCAPLMVVRTAVIDGLIRRILDQERPEAVVNLAAGLDARPYRLDLPPALRWHELDLPPVLEYKQSVLAGEPAGCVVERIPVDLLEPDQRRQTFDRIAGESGSKLVICEGLLVYLAPEEVDALLADLHARPTFRWLVTDLAHPRTLRWFNRQQHFGWKRHDLVMRFAPEEGLAFFQQRGWNVLEFHPLAREARKHGRSGYGPALWKLLDLIALRPHRTPSGVVFLERSE